MTDVPLGIDIDTQEDTADPLTIAGLQSMVMQNRLVAVASGVQTVSSAIMTMQMLEMRKQIAEEVVATSQERTQMAYFRYEEALRRLGPNAQETLKAHRELIIAQNNMERSTMRANRMMELSYLEIIPTTLNIIAGLIAVTAALAMASQGAYKHSGGVISETGLYNLEAGETIMNRDMESEHKGEYHEHSSGAPGLSVDHHSVYEPVENENRRKFSISSRAQ